MRRPNLLSSGSLPKFGSDSTPFVKRSVRLVPGSGYAIGWLSAL